MKKIKYMIKHSHKHGINVHLFKSIRRRTDLPSIHIVCEVLGIDYDENDATQFIDLNQFHKTPFDDFDKKLKFWRASKRCL
jgi:hypothetical protein